MLEELYGDQTADIAVALAYHYREAGDEAKALPYLVQAGDYARDQYANEEAEGYYRAAVDLMTKSQQRASLVSHSLPPVYSTVAQRPVPFKNGEGIGLLGGKLRGRCSEGSSISISGVPCWISGTRIARLIAIPRIIPIINSRRSR